MNSLSRFFQICFKLTPPFLSYSLTRKNPQSKRLQKATISIRYTLQELGPTFTKFGQLLSARPDIVGPELANELRNLLDKEPQIPFSVIKQTIEKELDLPFHDIFTSFDEKPLATASIGQVHKALLKNGHTVAVKVMRPHIEEIIQKDLIVIKHVAALLDSLPSLHKLHFTYIYKEFSEWITNELDFEVEGRRADKFAENMSVVEGITIPTVFWKYSTKKVLTMSFIEGRTLNSYFNEMKEKSIPTLYELEKKEAFDVDLLLKRIIRAVAKQALVDRFFHGDLHPANIIIQKHNKLAFIDFGIVGTLDAQEHTQILLTLLALSDTDPQALLKVMLSIITEPLTQEEVAELQQEFSDELHKLHEDTGGKAGLNHFIMVILSLAPKYNMRWSPGFLLAIKTIAQIDSVATQVGLKTPIVELMKPEVEKAVTSSLSQTFSKETVYKSLLDLIEAGKRLPQTINEFEQLISSGQLVNIQPVLAARKKTSAVKNGIVFASALIISYPFVTTSFIKDSGYFIFLAIVIPLLLYYLLGKIFKSERG